MAHQTKPALCHLCYYNFDLEYNIICNLRRIARQKSEHFECSDFNHRTYTELNHDIIKFEDYFDHFNDFSDEDGEFFDDDDDWFDY